MDRTAQFYSQPTYARGSGMPVFAGSRRQRGGGVLGSLKSFFMPILSRLGITGTQAAMNVAQNVAQDLVSGKNIAASLKQHGLQAAKRLGNEVLSNALDQVNLDFGVKRKTAPKRKSAPKSKAAPSRKRPAPSKAKQTAKRAKANF